MKRLLLLVALLALLPGVAKAQGDYGSRLQGANGWALPVATTILGSDEEKHLGRGSVNAWDLVAPLGSAIYAMAPGVVEYAGCNNAGGYGCWVLLRHAGGYSSSYGHMINGSIKVKSGQAVDANTLLGQVGWTGKTSFGPHTHFEIRHGGRFIRIDQFFNIDAMKQCDLCSVQGAPVAAQSIVAAPQTPQATQAAPNALQRILATMTAEQFATLVTALVTLLMLAWWLFGLYVRVGIVAATTTAITALFIALLFLPSAPTVANQPSVAVGGDTWKAAYTFMRKWEGARCVHDPVRTFKGITNGTYNAWRRDSGLGPGDVCRDLTEQQAEAIYYQRYWLASGANRLTPPTAIAVFDHAVNAGVGSAKSLLAQCGDNANCVIQARFADYRTKRNFPQYGRAWFNRVNDMIKFLKLVR